MNAKIILGLGFGDEGKGRTIDWLCSNDNITSPIVIRFSAGQQCGHTVIYNGIKHVHSSYGSGTLRGIPSYFSSHCTIYLPNLYNELTILAENKINPTLYVHPLAMLTTPYDIAYNRMMERRNNHGSCGLGVAATNKRNETGYKLYAIDLYNNKVLLEKLKSIKSYYFGLIQKEIGSLALEKEFLQLCDEQPIEQFISLTKDFNNFFSIKDYSFLKNYTNLFFEGSQGIMLDMNHGIFPNVTYANTTSKNAIEICKSLLISDIEIWYVTRCYQTRHGNGWMSNEDSIELINNENEINSFNIYQKDFRIGEIDYDLLNYALLIDNIYSDGFKKKLVVTCMDQRKDFFFDFSKIKKFSFEFFYSSNSVNGSFLYTNPFLHNL